ncbi:Alpha/Beta hydrolase protein [Microdochium trichocladiopsis]|uniref:Alpha/Beta hydrolase protein n=1 Tax=Microdochium trichocladiopsis TaxID=1682393 RepID=A0A9P8XVC9_9PEZI|nr:Alpha/Beta hydrolase protein [Microdochium trichocladiopsis]KAH7018581.1 Alpha/Beta hydrolase protein [Microdochium trichocladiopsis]
MRAAAAAAAASTSATSTLARSLQARASSTHDATFRLPDGRALGYAEYGSPRGLPLFVLHGFPSSRLEAGPLDSIGQRKGIRIISLDRPGFGLSTPQPGRTMTDFAWDMAAFARAMNIRRFAVAGFSGGGPYALACAHVLPRQTVGAVGMFASGPPWAAGAEMMSRPRRVMRWMAVHWPWGLRVLLDAVMGTLRWVSQTQFVKRKTEEWLVAQDEKKDSGELAKLDQGEHVEDESGEGEKENKESKTVSERREILFRIVDEPFAQGAAATVEEAALLSAPEWGFRLEDVEYAPAVRIWHGTDDTNAPIAAIRYLADKVPHAVLTELAGKTHYTVYPYIEKALDELAEDFKRGG